MDSHPLVSVVIPAYNAEKTLARTLTSVLSQTWTELQVIVVDDASSDCTLSIARDFEAKDPRAGHLPASLQTAITLPASYKDMTVQKTLSSGNRPRTKERRERAVRKINGGKKLLSALLVLIMLVFSFPAAYAEDIPAEIIAEEAVTELSAETAETAGSDQAPVPETEPVQDQEADPEAGQEPIMSQDDPVAEPAPVLPEEVPAETPAEAEAPEEVPAETPAEAETPEEVPAETPADAEVPEEVPAETPAEAEVPEEVPAEAPAEAEVPEEVPTETPAETEIPEEVPAEAPAEAGTQEEAPTAEPGDGQEAEEEPAGSEESGEEEVFEFDDDPGTVSEELLEPFNNPEAKEPADFTGTIEIEIKTREICYDQPVTLVARISEEIGISCRLVWEANDGDGRGWYAVGSGLEYTFTLTRDIVDREYRVVLFTVD